MILAFLGGIVFLIGAGSSNVPVVIVGAVMVVIGVFASDSASRSLKARANRTEYWANMDRTGRNREK